MGLEVDERLKSAAIEAIQNYGITYPSSRAYASNTLYSQLEELVQKMYNAPIVLATSLSLGHHGVMPVLVDEGDAIIMDQQVHTSVQDAARKLRCNGIHLDIVRHNHLEQLETKIRDLSKKHAKVWYICDGVYSMFGDVAPLKELVELADRYKNFHLYIDDAHGMTVFGKNGTGYVMSKVKLHPKMVLCTGMAKAFGSVGGIYIIPDQELATKVKNCAGPLIFSGQQATPLLAASIASAKIHLSSEITEKQEQLAQKIRYCHALLKEYHLPDISHPETPIFFLALGTIGLGFNMVKRMINDGFFTNIAAFPAVAEVHTGIRFTVTTHLTFEDIENFVKALAKNFPLALKDEDRTVHDIQKAFRKTADLEATVKYYGNEDQIADKRNPSEYIVQYETSIQQVCPELWNRLLGNRGTFTWEELVEYEKMFHDNELPEHNVSFHYYIIKDHSGIPLLATFFTVGLTKNDLLSPPSVSFQIQQTRRTEPYYQTCKAMTMGAMVTEGNHLFVDKSYGKWKDVLKLLLRTVSEEQEKQNADMLIFRDFDANDQELNDFFLNMGYLKTSLPDTHVISSCAWESRDEFLHQFDKHRRQYLKQKVFKYENSFDVEIVQKASIEKFEYWQSLYLNVKEKSFEINTFSLPQKFFESIATNSNWEVIELKLKADFDVRTERKAVAVMFCLKTAYLYCPLYVGLDYDLLDYNIYPQILWQTILRAKNLGLPNINLGFTASQNKKKFGAEAIAQVGFVQMRDNFNMSLLSLVPNEMLVEKISR